MCTPPARTQRAGDPARLAEFRALPGLGEAPRENLGEPLGGVALLSEGIAVTKRDRAVFGRLVVDRDRPRGPDLVLAPVAPADRAALVVLGGHHALEVLVDLVRGLGLALLAQEREDGHLHRGEQRVEPEQRALLALD